MLITKKDGLDEMFLKEEKFIKKLSYTNLLADLLFLNYEYSNKKYHNVTGSQIYNSMQDQIRFSETEKKEIINDAISLIKIKYNVNVKDFENLIIEKKK